MKNKIRTLILTEEGQGMVEYGLLMAFVAFIAFLSIIALSDEAEKMFQRVTNLISERNSF